ncbi:hypothetical protein ABFS82_06G020100 [Erythranthe guttata]|uniref:A-kinase anchor protein 9 isoform X1 n=1 Tax=Erythranthe guttata TaxID=4155 RepID=UPI00064DF1D1|nr:PREDICTED: A-kinase anchor protein 9 isoform X1 [Erythranthe guttata]XP_012852251.1 PREDICTED: A-kinase anchor protein 9 isoform X1 [Erythranthe guttata]|eukprot:XP_012852250.1 PREDICTED: A-kinase anchor protein 9 isoform X1 [Erythranthe guttata]
MEEKGMADSEVIFSDEDVSSFYPMFFGVSCAFFALRLLPAPEICHAGAGDNNWSEIRNRMLKGSAHLLGLFIYRAKTGKKSNILRNLENAENQIQDLKKRRSEEAKANEKVMSIFAAREQSWFNDRRNLRQQIGSLMNELRVLEAKRDKSVFELNEKLQEKDRSISEIEEKLNKAENLAQRHCSEILKHKTTFIELVSNQRQLEADMGRALRQVESARRDLDSVLDQKEQSVLMAQRLSMELVKIRKDSEQKDQILSAMLRKSKLDTNERQMLLNEVKSSSKVKHERERHSLRNMLSYKHVNESLEDVEDLENWAEKYKISMQQRHNLEIEAFAEQMRIKDEKLEASRWRLLSMELESKRLQSHIEGLDCDVLHLRQENMKLESLLIDRESELHSMKEQLVLQFNPPNLQKLNFSPSPATNENTVWSKVKIVKTKPEGQKSQEKNEEVSQSENNEKDIVLTLEYPQFVDSDIVSNESSKKNNSVAKIDIHALGVSYKIKRLKQQFLMLERLTGKKQENSEIIENKGINGIYELISTLNKQADRYQSLQAKTDDICQRMSEKELNLNCGSSGIARTEEETKRLENYLDETFKLQRYIVATGQKLMEVQSKIAFGFVAYSENIEKPDNFDMKRFADSIRTMFREVQRGLEVRISRIIGDLEGTLAFDGIINFKKIVWN